MFSLANPLGGEQEVAATETPPNRLGVTLLTLARALERIYEILQPPAPEATDDQPRDEEVPDQPPTSTARPHGHESLIHRATHSHIPAPVGERAKRAIPQDVKIAVSARDGGRCRQCGSTQQLHFDHVIPISRGGANTVANIQLLCGACNRAKGAKLELTAYGAGGRRARWSCQPTCIGPGSPAPARPRSVRSTAHAAIAPTALTAASMYSHSHQRPSWNAKTLQIRPVPNSGPERAHHSGVSGSRGLVASSSGRAWNSPEEPASSGGSAERPMIIAFVL
jgi:hypothetical protein